jgi:hypothetical protein
MKAIILNKPRGLYGKLMLRLKEIEHNHKFIPWSNSYEKLCRNYSLNKQEIREIIFILRDFGLVDVSPLGIKLNFEVKNG